MMAAVRGGKGKNKKKKKKVRASSAAHRTNEWYTKKITTFIIKLFTK